MQYLAYMIPYLFAYIVLVKSYMFYCSTLLHCVRFLFFFYVFSLSHIQLTLKVLEFCKIFKLSTVLSYMSLLNTSITQCIHIHHHKNIPVTLSGFLSIATDF
jgi:hypothetical protein